MKNIIKIFIVIIATVNFCDSQAQQLSKADLLFIKDIQNTIVNMVDSVDNGFDRYIVEGEVVKDNEIVQFPSSSIATMHCINSLVLKNVDSSANLLAFEYNALKPINLVYKAVIGMPKFAGNKWSFKQKMDAEKNTVTKYLYCGDKPIAYYVKPDNNNFFYFYFLNIPKGNLLAENAAPDAFMSDLDRQLDSIYNAILKPDSVKIGNLQTALEALIEKGKDGFIDMIFAETLKDESMTYYQAAFQKNMKAQNCQGIKLMPSGGKYFLCSYTKQENVNIAIKAIEGLQAGTDSSWQIEDMDMEDANLVGKKIFYEGNYAAYTTYIKDTKAFYIAVKDQTYVPENPKAKQKIVSKKKK